MPSEYRQADCDGKERFTSYGQALRSCQRQNRFRRRVEVFKCSWCHGWHRGGQQRGRHTRWRVRREELRQAAESAERR